MHKLTIEIYGDSLPVVVTFEYQQFVAEEIIDNIKSDQIEPSVNILSICHLGYDLEQILSPNAVENIRSQCLNIMSKLSEAERDND